MVALARGMLYDPRWPWHAAAQLGGQVDAPRQYWRSQPREHKALFGETRLPALTRIRHAKAPLARRRFLSGTAAGQELQLGVGLLQLVL